jgi:hypothetical protein
LGQGLANQWWSRKPKLAGRDGIFEGSGELLLLLKKKKKKKKSRKTANIERRQTKGLVRFNMKPGEGRKDHGGRAVRSGGVFLLEDSVENRRYMENDKDISRADTRTCSFYFAARKY